MTQHITHRAGIPAMTLYDDLAYENGLPVIPKSAGRHRLSSSWRRRWINWNVLPIQGFRINCRGGAFK
jgi:hypothetical protein